MNKYNCMRQRTTIWKNTLQLLLEIGLGAMVRFVVEGFLWT